MAWKETKQGRLQEKARKTGHPRAHQRAFKKTSSGNELKIEQMNLKDNETKGREDVGRFRCADEPCTNLSSIGILAGIINGTTTWCFIIGLIMKGIGQSHSPL